MATEVRLPAAPLTAGLPADAIARQLFSGAGAFDFFQAVRLLERLSPDRQPVGYPGKPGEEVVRLRAYPSLAFPPSAVQQLTPPPDPESPASMVVSFMGLFGPSGTLPLLYTHLIVRKGLFGRSHDERHGLREWLDLFNHRLLSLFYRAWEKYRFYLPYEREEFGSSPGGRGPDAFTQALYSLVGQGMPALRSRLQVVAREGPAGAGRERRLAHLEDLGVLHYAGLFARQPRCAAALEAVLRGFLGKPVTVLQFQGQWLYLEPANQSAIANRPANNRVGENVIVGDRIWDVQSKIRVRIGPLSYAEFSEFVPDRSPTPERKTVFLVAQLIRLYVGPELDIEIQPILRAHDVPRCEVGGGSGARLGWNTWSRRLPMKEDARDAVFRVDDRTWNAPIVAGDDAATVAPAQEPVT